MALIVRLHCAGHTLDGMRVLFPLLLLTGCGLPGLTSEDVFGLEPVPRAWAYGVVTDARTSGPISGATLQLGDASATSDVNGAFRLDGQLAGTAQLAASRQEFQTLAEAVELKPGANRLDVRLFRISCGTCGATEVCDAAAGRCVEAASISGDIVNVCTGAVVVARVTVDGKSTCAIPGKGYWQLTGLRPGGPQALVAGKDGYEPYRADVTLVSGFNTLDKISLNPIGGCSAPPPTDTPCTCVTAGCQ